VDGRSTNRTAVYGPVRTVVWEGWSREAPPYPDFSNAWAKSGGGPEFFPRRATYQTPLPLDPPFLGGARDRTRGGNLGRPAKVRLELYQDPSGAERVSERHLASPGPSTPHHTAAVSRTKPLNSAATPIVAP